MPFGHKDPHVIINEIKMTRRDAACVVVEGPDDHRFWNSRKHTECELVHGEGKRNVLEAVRILNERGCTGILGIVDDDYDELLGVTEPPDNIVVVRPHSLECLMCQTSALYKVLSEFGDASKIREYERAKGIDIRTALFARAAIFGRVR